MNLVHNERTKYTATLVNTVAAAGIVAGVLAPLVAFTFGVPGPISGTLTVVVSAAWLLVGLCLHLLARALLGGLRE